MNSDIERWSNLDNIRDTWNERTELLHRFIPTDATTILEFGAGKRHLETLLLDSQTYIHSDIVKRNSDTIVQDLNNLPYDFLHEKYDVIFCSGVFEYIINLRGLINYIGKYTDCIVCSYANTYKDREISKRNGWVNFYNQSQLQLILLREGFSLNRKTIWKGQTLYLFTK